TVRMALAQEKDETLQVHDFVPLLESIQVLRSIVVRNQHIVVVEHEKVPSRQASSDVERPSSAIGHVITFQRRVDVSDPLRQMVLDLGNGGLFDHYALKRDIALRGQAPKRQKEVRQTRDAAVTNDKGDLDVAALSVRVSLKPDRPITKRKSHEESS